MMLYCLLFVKSFAVHEIQTHEQLPPSYIFEEPLEFFQAIMVALEKFLHCIWSKFYRFLTLFCTAICLEKYIMTKKSILHYALILFFLPSALGKWLIGSPRICNYKEKETLATSTTTYASLEAKLQQQKFSGWWSQIYNIRLHFCSTYWISVKCRNYHAWQLQMPLAK